MVMRGCDRKVPKDESETVPHAGLQLLDDRIGGTAIRTLVVAVLDQRHCRVCRSLDVVAVIVDRDGEDGVPLGRAHQPPSTRLSRARRIPSAPGLIPTG